MTTATYAREFAACLRKMAGSSKIMQPARNSSKPIDPGHEACLVIDAYLPGMDGFELLRRLSDAGHRLPAIMITGNSDVPMAVQAMKAGAVGLHREADQPR